MTLWRCKRLSCDGGRLGKVWQEWFFLSEGEAKNKLYQEVSDRNTVELDRGSKCRWKPDTVEGVEGYCNWQYGSMLICDRVEVELPSKEKETFKSELEDYEGEGYK